jgi:hypothetical protein
MPRAPTGTIVEHHWKDGRTVSFAARVPFHGRKHYVTFGTDADGWNRERAEIEAEKILADIRRGSWVPPERSREGSAPDPPVPEYAEETIHITLSRWWQTKKTGLAPEHLPRL